MLLSFAFSFLYYYFIFKRQKSVEGKRTARRVFLRSPFEDNMDDIKTAVTGFILEAPPEKLSSVLGNIRRILEDDELFLDLIPPLCLEYYLKHSSIFLLPIKPELVSALDLVPSISEELGASSSSPPAMPIVISEENHLVSFVRRASACIGRTSRDFDDINVWDEIGEEDDLIDSMEEYLAHIPAYELQGDTSRSSTLSLLEEDKEDFFDRFCQHVGIESIHNVFFYPHLHLYVEIDPIEGGCIRALPFLTLKGSPLLKSLKIPTVVSLIENSCCDLIDTELSTIQSIIRELNTYLNVDAQEWLKQKKNSAKKASPMHRKLLIPPEVENSCSLPCGSDLQGNEFQACCVFFPSLSTSLPTGSPQLVWESEQSLSRSILPFDGVLMLDLGSDSLGWSGTMKFMFSFLPCSFPSEDLVKVEVHGMLKARLFRHQLGSSTAIHYSSKWDLPNTSFILQKSTMLDEGRGAHPVSRFLYEFVDEKLVELSETMGRSLKESWGCFRTTLPHSVSSFLLSSAPQTTP